MALDTQGIQDLYNEFQSGAPGQADAINKSKAAGNPWAINIINQYQQQFGRMPTATEIAAAGPSFQQGDTSGNSYIAQLKQQQDNTPANIYAQQQKQWQGQAPQNYDSINQMTQSLLGRAATQDELSHYGTLIASGQADPYQIQQFIQATPEYQNTQDTQFRSGVDTQLQQSDTDFFNTQKGNIAQQYAQMGRATSPALDVALTQLASQLNSNRQTYLAQLSASQYGGNKAAALQNYGNTQSQVQSQINQNTAGIYGNNQAMMQRANQLSDYSIQQNAFNQSQSQYGPKANWMDYLNAGVNAGKGVAQGTGAIMTAV